MTGNKKIAALCIVFILSVTAFAVAGPLPDTGQAECYNSQGAKITCPQIGQDYYGQDASYSVNPPSYTKLDAQGNDLDESAGAWAIVRDEVTGLMWEIKTDDGSVHDKDNKYIWQDTENFINSLNSESFGGFSDWRVPTIKELASIANLGIRHPAITTEYFDENIKNLYDITTSASYWSSTPHASKTDYVWCFNFWTGYDADYNTSAEQYVIAVRGEQIQESDRWVDNGDGTITDRNTGLMWQKVHASSVNWKDALSHCENMNLAGYPDWRLPNREELRSVVDYSKYDPAIDTDFFPGTESSGYWSSTTCVSKTPRAWLIDFSDGKDDGSSGDKSGGFHVRAVRGGIDTDTVPPSVIISNPTDNSSVEELFEVKGTASDTVSRVSQVELQITDGLNYVNQDQWYVTEAVWVKATGTESWSFNTSLVDWTIGTSYTITIRATDTAGNSSGTSITFTFGGFSKITCDLTQNSITLGEPLEVSGNITPPPSEGGAWVKVTFTSSAGEEIERSADAQPDGTFTYKVCGEITHADIWTVRTSWSGDQNLQGAASDDKTLEVSKAETRVTLDVTSQAIKNDEDITITGKFTPEPDCGANLSDIPIKLKITGPDGSAITKNIRTGNELGNFMLEKYADINSLLGEWIIQAIFEGNDAYKPSDSDTVKVRVVETAGYAIIVQGKIGSEEGVDSHNKTTNFVYDQLKKRGLLDDDIKYFNYNKAQSNVDEIPSKTAIEEAVIQWAAGKMNDKPANLYIVMVDHGVDDIFFIDPDTITSADLDGWLDTLQGSLTGQAKDQELIVILGFCRSGSFIDDLSGDNRIIITSAAPGESSYKGPLDEDEIREGEYFISEFFKAVSFGKSLKQCFEEAVAITEIFTSSGSGFANAPYYDNSLQHPLLDDNGDGEGSNDTSGSYEDGLLSKSIFIGVSSITHNDPGDVRITQVTETKFISQGDNSLDLWAKADDDSRLRTIWVEVKPPDYTPVGTDGSGQAEMILPKTITVDYNDQEKRHEWKSLKGFSEPGTYQVFYFAKDDITGNVSPLMESKVYKARSGNSPPDEFSLISPENSATVSPSYYKDENAYLMILEWENTSDPDGDGFSYTILLSKTDTFDHEDIIRKENVKSGISIVKVPLDWVVNDYIYWKVQAIDEYAAVRDSDEVWIFRAMNDNPSTGIVEFHIRNASDLKYIKKAVIIVKGVNGEKNISVSNGIHPLGISVPPNSYEVTVKAMGYGSKTGSIEIIEGDKRPCYFDLDPGDINSDDIVDLKDVISALKMMAGIQVAEEISKAADINGDGRIGLEEAVYIIQCSAGLKYEN